MNHFKAFTFFFALIFSLGISCQTQNKTNNIQQIEIPMEQRVISTPENTNDGFFSIENSLIDKVVISDFKTMISKKASLEKTISDKSIIQELVSILKRLPEKGDIYKKLAPTSSFCQVQFFAGEKLAGTAKIYNNSLQMANTAFLAEKNKDEELFIARVKELLGQ